MKFLSLTSLLVALLTGMLAGCGGGAKPGAGQPAPAAPVNAPVVNQPAPVPAPAAPDLDQKGEAAAEPSETAGDDLGAETVNSDEFEVNTDETILELNGEMQEPQPEPVEVVALPPGFDSTTLEVVSPDSESSSAAPAQVTVAPPVASVPESTPPPKGRAARRVPSKVPSTTETSAGWALPDGATPVEGAGTDPETGLPRKITMERDPVEMVLIPPGVFVEGVDGQEPQAGPRHSVLLENPYYIDVVEVTVARHDAFREFLRKSEGRRMDPALNHDGNPDAPAVGLKYLDAKFYAKWTGKELPTEAQWERAARGDDGFDYPWGNGRPIWHLPRQPGQLDPVATFSGDLSPFGLYDMAGNAREWCLDLYSPDAYRKDVATGGNPVRNPTGPKTFQGVKLQVVKGGRTDWAAWHRAGQPQTEVGADIGFRCVLNVSGGENPSDKNRKDKTPAPGGADKKQKPDQGL